MTTNLIALCSLVNAIAARVAAGGEPPANTADGAVGHPTPPPDLDEGGESSTGWLTPAGLLQQNDCGEDERGYYGACVVHTRAEALAAWRSERPLTVIEEVTAERQRQIGKGYDAAHDDEATEGEIGDVAGLVVLNDEDLMMDDGCREVRVARYIVGKHPDRREQLIIASALLIAEIERLDRATARGGR
jgi:hypothetical protein